MTQQQQQQLDVTLEVSVDKVTQTTPGINEAYVGGAFFEHGTRRQLGTFGITMTEIDTVTNAPSLGLNSGMLKVQLFFAQNVHPHGGGGGGGGAHHGRAPETIVGHAAPQLQGQAAPQPGQRVNILEAIGSVSATSAMWEQLRDRSLRITSMNAQGTELRLQIV